MRISEYDIRPTATLQPIRYLAKVVGGRQAYQVANDYLIGATNKGAAVMWHLDASLQPMDGRVLEWTDTGMELYCDPVTRHLGGIIPYDTYPCLFGRHLAEGADTVNIVKDYLACLIFAVKSPQDVFLSTGGQLVRRELFEGLGRTKTTIFPTSVAETQEWIAATADLPNVKINTAFMKGGIESDIYYFLSQQPTPEYVPKRRRLTANEMFERIRVELRAGNACEVGRLTAAIDSGMYSPKINDIPEVDVPIEENEYNKKIRNYKFPIEWTMKKEAV